MTIEKHRILETFAVIKPDLKMQPVPVTSTLYDRLQNDFDNFRGHVLVSVHEFSESRSHWERHPAGDEMVVLLAGKVTLRIQKHQGEEKVDLNEPCSYVIIPRGAWHIAETQESARMLFITPGEGTEHNASV